MSERRVCLPGGDRRRLRCAFVAMPLLVVAAAMPSSGADITAFTDTTGHFAASAARWVGLTNNWLPGYGTSFRPTAFLSRGQLAVALTRAFAREEIADPAITFADIAPTVSLARYAAIATAHRWLLPSDGRFLPAGHVTKTALDRALVLALGLGADAAAINRIRSSDGYVFKRPTALGYQIIASKLAFHYNYPGAAGLDPVPSTNITRGDAAYALRAATVADEWRLRSVQQFRDIVLPPLTPIRRKVIEFALRYMGHPYVYANATSRGFDCSGFVWWVLRAGSGPSSRGYAGWSLPQRSSYEMARATTVKRTYGQLRPLDVMLFDYEGEFTRAWQGVGHAGFYIGNGWMMHSSGGSGGATIAWVGEGGHWGDKLVWGRRIVPNVV